MDTKEKKIEISLGKILVIKRNVSHLKIFSYSPNTREYFEKKNYKEIIFPNTFNIRKYLYFKRNGNYMISYETQFKKIINPQGKEIGRIILTSGRSNKKIARKTLELSTATFVRAINDAKGVFDKKKKYAGSVENYQANLESRKYGNDYKKKTTYMERGEFSFLVDRLNIETKKNKKDYLKYLNSEDLVKMETLIDEVLKNEVLSEGFIRRLNDYFIKEKLKDIVALGNEILSLGTTSLNTVTARKIITQLGSTNITQLENIWQKYFEKYLLYLIFSYKKIFPKIELENIDGDKKYPDFIGINHYYGLDVIEIKTHLKNILVWDSSHENFYFSAEMSKAIVQTMNYLDAITQHRFKKVTDKSKITDVAHEENLYHPRGIIVISSAIKISTKTDQPEKLKRDFTKLRSSLQNIEILTFDEILGIADEYIKNIVSEVPNL